LSIAELSGMPTNLLTDKQIKAKLAEARRTGTPVRVVDGDGLYLEAQPNGKGWWRLRYWLHSREGRMSLGTYPEVPLAGRWIDEPKRKAKEATGYLRGARDLRDEARALIADGRDPVEHKKAVRSAAVHRATAQRLASEGKPVPGTFEYVAREWLEKIHAADVVPAHFIRNKTRLEQMVFPKLGARPIADIEPQELLEVLRPVEDRGHVETARRVNTLCAQVFGYALASGLCRRNPAVDVRSALKTPQTRHHAALVKPDDAAALMRAIFDYDGSPVTVAALKLSALLMLRPGEVRQMEWVWIDWDERIAAFPASAMKGTRTRKAAGEPHLVPLASQAIEVLRELQPLTGRSRFVFPSERTRERPMSDGTVNAAIRRMGFTKSEMTAHGFRAMARTLAAEKLKIDPEFIEAQLAHAVPETHGRAYNRTQFIDERRELMVKWADYLDRLRTGNNVVGLKSGAA
jgi:integrase